MKLPSVIVFCAAVVSTAFAAGPISYFRANHGRAAQDDVKLPVDFGAKENLLWKTPLGTGISSPCVAGDSVFVTTWDRETKELATVAIDRQNGKVRWTRAITPREIEKVHAVGSPASSTPASDGVRVYSFFGSHGLLCYDFDGKLLWEQRMGPFQDEFGASSSPVLADGKVFLNEDHDVGSFVAAFDKLTGKEAWKTSRAGTTRSYSTPVVIETDAGQKQLIVAGSLQLTAYDMETGNRLWWFNGLSRIVDPTPVYANGLLYIATWTPGGDESQRIAMDPFSAAVNKYDENGDELIAKSELPDGAVLARFFRIDLNQDEKLDSKEWAKHARVFERAQNVAIAIDPDGKGDVTETHVKWTHRRSLPTVPSSVVYRGVMYMVKDGGIITSLDAATGEKLHQARAVGRGNYYSSIVAGDGKVYLASERGVITVLKAGKEFEILGSHDFGERIMATPVIAEGTVYVRTDVGLWAFGVR